MENKKVSIPFYEGMELKMRVDSGFLVAEYSEEEKKTKGIDDLPIGSMFEYDGKYYLVQKGLDCGKCPMYSKDGKCDLKAYKCAPPHRKDNELVIYKEVKDGDIIIRKCGNENFIVIFKSYRDAESINYHAALLTTISLTFNDYCDSIGVFKMATEEEKQQLLDAMHKNGKDWDAVNKKIVDYIKPLKVGDMCIFWDDDKSKSVISFLSKISAGIYFDSIGLVWMHATKFESIEQYKEFIK